MNTTNYIRIFRGDDSDALGYQTIVGTIKTDLDLTGCRAVFRFLGFYAEFNPIPEDGKLTIVIPAQASRGFPPGVGYASLRVFDSLGKIRTFTNRIPVIVDTMTPSCVGGEFEVSFSPFPELEPLKIFIGPNADDFDQYTGFLSKIIDRASLAKYGLVMLADAMGEDGGASGKAASPLAVKAAYDAIIQELTDNYYTSDETDEAIDRVAAYYITYDAAGNPFPTYASLANATTVYSGEAVRVPTRNDYCVVLADETHDNAEYRYIYAVAEGQTTGSWQPQFPVEGVMTIDQTVVQYSQNPVSGGGVWSMLWGALGAIPGGLSSVYAWVLNRLGLKRDLTDMACTVAVAGIPQIGSGNFVVTSPSGTSTTLNPFDSYGVVGWGWYNTYPYIYARASNSYDIIFGLGISDIIPLDMTAETQTVTHNGETWTVDAYTGETVNTRLANMTDIPAASTSTPQMDGTGAAGSSVAFARGDHVHPTDTSRMAASATGANIAVSGTDATKISAALAGKASKADATLTERGYSEWSIVHTPLSDEAKEMFFDESADAAVNDYAVTIRGNDLYVGDYDVASLLLSSDGLRYAFSVGSPAASTIWGPNGTTVATRELLSGCILGPNDPSNPNCDKPLASEAEAEALRTGKADVSAIPYSLGTPIVIDTASLETVEGETVYYGAATLADRTANIIQVTAATPLDELRIMFPSATSGKVRDFGLRVEIGTGSAALAAPALVPIAPTGETIKLENADGTIPELADGTATAKGVTLLYFSETSPGVFVVKGEQVEEVA